MSYFENNEKVIGALAILGEPMRVRILELIASVGPLRSMDILPQFSISQPTMSHHLSLMTDSEVLIARKTGRCIYFSINVEMLNAISSYLQKLTQPPIVSIDNKVRLPKVKKDKASKLSLKKNSSVPKPKVSIEAPDIEEIKSKLKKKKDSKKKNKKKKNKM